MGGTGSNVSSSAGDVNAMAGEIPYAQWGNRLSASLFVRLVERLPRELLDGEENGKGPTEPINILASVPFFAFKAALESSAFPMVGDQDRVSLI